MSVEQQVWNYFKQKGFTNYGTAGIMGNIYAESRFLPNNLQDNGNKQLGLSDTQYTQKVDNKEYTNFNNDGYGYGLVQWTYNTLKADLYNLCKVRKKSIADVDCQLEIIYYHLQTHKILDDIKKATSIRQASDLFLTKFERPKDQSESVKKTRASYGQKYYNQFVEKEVKKAMKYGNNQKPLVCMMTQSSCYRGTRKMAVKGILWHSTGANNPTLKRYVQPDDNDPNRQTLLNKIGVNPNGNDWNHMAIEAGLNAWIGQLADGTVAAVQTMPWDYAPWGCGAGSRGSCNNGWIQFEICEDNLNNSGYFQKVYTEACELTAYLCKLYNIDPKGKVSFNGVQVPTILCHQDSYQLGLGSNHGDVYHWFNKYGRTMDTVRNDVANLLKNSGGSITPTPTPTPTPITPDTPSKPTLRKGSEGSDVEYLQSCLVKLGYSVGSYGIDGDFGNDTYQAVRKFQSNHQLPNDGIVGQATWAAIEQALKNSTPPVDEIYRVRKSWDQPGTQIGAFKDLNNAKHMVDVWGSAYHVYNSKGQEVYPAASASDKPVQTVATTVTTETILPVATSYSGVKIGHACHDERGKYVGGTPGDQDGTEVQIANWYNQNWNYVLRPKNQPLAERIARACELGCNNNKIGYSQSARNTIYVEALKVGLDLSKITTPCNCDCSSFVSTCCIIAGLPASIFYAGGNMRTTYTLKQAAEATNQFTIYTSTSYTRSKDYLKRGDILLNSNQHTAIVLSNGSKAAPDVPATIQQPSIQTSSTVNYLARVTVNSLNVRSSPNSNASINGVIKNGGVYTIVQEEGGFGKLKSGAGWIDLKYVQKL